MNRSGLYKALIEPKKLIQVLFLDDINFWRPLCLDLLSLRILDNADYCGYLIIQSLKVQVSKLVNLGN